MKHLKNVLIDLKYAEFQVWRYKIVSSIFDSRISDDLWLLDIYNSGNQYINEIPNIGESDMGAVIEVDGLYLKYPPADVRNSDTEYHAYFTDKVEEARKFTSLSEANSSKVWKKLEKQGDSPKAVKL